MGLRPYMAKLKVRQHASLEPKERMSWKRAISFSGASVASRTATIARSGPL